MTERDGEKHLIREGEKHLKREGYYRPCQSKAVGVWVLDTGIIRVAF